MTPDKIGKCRTCVYWGVDYEGVCDRVGFADVELDDSSFELDLQAADDYGLSGRLVTGQNFGCVCHKVGEIL